MSRAQAFGGVLGDSELDSRGHGRGLTVQRAPPVRGSACRCPATPMTPVLQHHLTGPRWVPRLYNPSSLPGPSSVHQLLLRPESIRPTLGPQCFLLHKRVDSVPPREGWREGTGGDWLQCAGSLAHRAASDFVQPRSVLCVCVPCLCACKRASVDSPRNMHFGTRLVTSHTSFSLRPCFNLKR